MAPSSRHDRLFWAVALGVIALDAATKEVAMRSLRPQFVPHRIIGNAVRFTLMLNEGAAFSMKLGAYQRWIFSAFAAVALVILWRLFRETRPGDRLRVVALALAWGGAAGNLISRLDRGAVIDFIDIGYNDVRFWTFNVADSAVTVGAILLACLLWKNDVVAEGGKPEAPGDAPVGGASV